MTIDGSTLAISTNCGSAACDAVSTAPEPTAKNNTNKTRHMSGNYRPKLPGQSIPSGNSAGNVGFCDPLQEKARGFVRDVEMDFEIGSGAGHVRRLSEKHQLRIRHP